MEVTAISFAMSIPSEIMRFDVCACGPSRLSYALPASSRQTARKSLKSTSFFQTVSFHFASREYTASVDFRSTRGVFPRKQVGRNSTYRATFGNGRGGGKHLSMVSCIDQLRSLHSDGDHSVWPSNMGDCRVKGGNPGKCVDRQAVSLAGISNAVLMDQASGSKNSIGYASEDTLGHLKSIGAAEDDVACQNSVVVPDKASRTSKQLCVAVDVDEVLGSFLAALNVFIEETYSLHHELSEYHIYDFMKIWNCSQVEANQRVHAFFKSDHFKKGISPIPGAHETLLQLAAYCQLVVVTSRQHIIRELTLEWIERYYGGIFKEVHFGNHFALEGSAKPKSQICRSLGAHVLIDDNPQYALDCAECGIEVLLFDLDGAYPWSKTRCGPQHPLITRVKDWQEVEQALLARNFANLEKAVCE